MYDPTKHHRRSLRLPGYDYALAGAYYVTLCTHQRIPLFGQVVDGVMRLSTCGELLAACWRELPQHHAGIEAGPAVIMPNHLHGIIAITQDSATLSDQHRPGPGPGTVGAVIGGLKAAAARRINAMQGSPGRPVWQRNHYEHIVRDEQDWARICHYMEMNPAVWADDPENR